jgi:glutamyl-tRNA synthetase
MAPSPTGKLHIGTARTALFNYLFAKKEGGKFIIRVEDTDAERSKPEFEKDIIENLHWLGLEWDEGPDKGGEYGPYRQTERREIYKEYLKKLLEEKKAYYCFCSKDELEAKRQEQMSRGEAPKYNGKCCGLSEKEVAEKLAKNEPAVIRFKTPVKKVAFEDIIRDKVEFDSSLIGDFAIAKGLNEPLYNFAVVVDDYEMKISHIIRGEDHIPNTPKQVLLQEALGFPKIKYAHLPLILGEDKSKLSKRNDTVSVADYKEEGYLPEALINFIAFLGWNPGDEKEIYSLAALSKEFSLEAVQKAGAVFNMKRLDYINGFYIRQKSVQKLAELCQPYLPQAEPAYVEKVVGLYQERLKKLSEIKDLSSFFFQDELVYDKKILKWKDMTGKDVVDVLDKLEKLLSGIEKFDKENLEKILMPEAGIMGDRGKLLWPLRAALTGKEASAGPFEVAEVLGKEKTLKRIKDAKKLFK